MIYIYVKGIWFVPNPDAATMGNVMRYYICNDWYEDKEMIIYMGF